MAIDIMSPEAASSVKQRGQVMAELHPRGSTMQLVGSGQVTLSPYRCDDPRAPYVCNPAPNASPPSVPSSGYGTVKIDRNNP